MNISIKNQQKAEAFSTVFQHLKLFTENVNVTFEKSRMYLQSMDSSRVSVFELEIMADWFDKYEHTSTTNLCLGLNSVLLFKILNSRDKTQEIDITYTNDRDTLYLNFTSAEKSVFDKHFEMPLINIDEDFMQIPPMESQAELSINSTCFANIINQLKQFGDSIDIECSEEKITLSSNTQETGKMSVEIEIDDITAFSIIEDTTLRISFSINYLHHVCMYNKLSKDINIYLLHNFPMKIVYNLSENAKMTFYLAPKIDED